MTYTLFIMSDSKLDWLATGLSKEDAREAAEDYAERHPNVMITMVEESGFFGRAGPGENIKD